MKKVTIIIPCYNVEDFVEKCVISALEQDYENLEVIAIDNESKDQTYSKLLSIKNKYPNLIVDTAPNIFKYSWEEPVEKGLKLSTGDYITFICSDDYLEKNYISLCMKYIMSAPNSIKCLQSPIRNIVDNNPNGFQAYSYKKLEELKELLLQRSVVNTPTVIYSRELYEKGLLKSKPEKYLGAADYDLYCNLADNGVMIYPSPTWLGYNYRWHNQQCTWGMKKEGINYDKLIQDFWREKWKKN
jgi:glycosyltransferase involved in cell wall biosynthesis